MEKIIRNSPNIGRVYIVDNASDFKHRNRQEWERNSEFWLAGKMRHLADLFETVTCTLSNLLAEVDVLGAKITVVDTGCGEGWVIRSLEQAGFGGRYVGLDFNEKFLDALKARYPDNPQREFRFHDLEFPAPSDLVGQAHIVLNFFNLFELPQLDIAFSTIASIVRPNGVLLILHIDPITQLLAVSADMDDFRRNLKLYEQHRACLGYDKDIDIGDSRSGRYYRSLLYSVADYFRCARNHGLSCENIQEVVKTGNYVPQVYQLLTFRRQKGLS